MKLFVKAFAIKYSNFLDILMYLILICEHPMPDLSHIRHVVSDTMQTSKWGGGGIKQSHHSFTQCYCYKGVLLLSLARIKICISVWWIGGGPDPWLVFDARLFSVWREESFIWQLLIDTWATLWPFVEVSRPGIMRTNAPTFSDNRPTFRDYCPASVLSD